MEYTAEYQIDMNQQGATAGNIRDAIDKSLGIRDTSGIQIQGEKFALGVAYDLLQIGAGLQEPFKNEHITRVKATGIDAVIDSDILLRVEPLTASAEDDSKYTSIIIKVTKQGAKSIKAEVIEQIINKLQKK